MIRTFVAALALLASPALAQDRAAPIVAVAGSFDGFVMVADADRVIWQTPPATCPASTGDDIVLCHPRNPAELRWPWASVTKQMVAVLAMQLVEEGKLTLDGPVDKYLPPRYRAAVRGRLPVPTVRQLIQHQSGLRNANDTPKTAQGFPSAYSSLVDKPGWCLADRKAPGGEWQYNNCDYFVLDSIFQHVSGKSARRLFAERIAEPLNLTSAGLLTKGIKDEPLGSATARVFAGFGAGGGLAGTANELLTIDRALMAGRLLKPESRSILWAGDPGLGFMALGQWAFEAPLKGCAKPVRMIERRGAIDATQVRNIMLPDLGTSVIVFTTDGDFDFGEIWQGKGFAYDLLSAAVAC